MKLGQEVASWEPRWESPATSSAAVRSWPVDLCV